MIVRIAVVQHINQWWQSQQQTLTNQHTAKWNSRSFLTLSQLIDFILKLLNFYNRTDNMPSCSLNVVLLHTRIAIAKCFVRLSHGLGVYLFVTIWCCIETVYARIIKSSLWAATRTRVYHDKILCPWVKWFPSNESIKQMCPLKRCYFPATGSYNVKTVANRYRHAAYHNKHWRRAF